MSEASIVFVGGGNMARALISGGLRAGVLSASRTLVVEPDAIKRSELAGLGVSCVERAHELAGRLGPETAVVLAVKPQSLPEVARDLQGVQVGGRVVITILAGTPSERVRAALGGSARVVRAMPNLPAQLGAGCTAVCLGAGAREGDDALALRLFGAVGPVVERVDESLMDAFTAVAGSGPAYVFYLAEAMMRAAEALGFEASVADRVVRQVIAGSAAMLVAPGAGSAGAMRAAVTSKGGTTEAACGVLDEAGVMANFQRALTAARDRGRKLAK